GSENRHTVFWSSAAVCPADAAKSSAERRSDSSEVRRTISEDSETDAPSDVTVSRDAPPWGEPHAPPPP
ncbi:MAG: hypothetical protein IKT12_06610, partial [Thermoguttaceae bacterium]|nr:hypothetical protein [Thermoguttaceae bacterium]